MRSVRALQQQWGRPNATNGLAGNSPSELAPSACAGTCFFDRLARSLHEPWLFNILVVPPFLQNWNFFQGAITQDRMEAQMGAMSKATRHVAGRDKAMSLVDLGCECKPV